MMHTRRWVFGIGYWYQIFRLNEADLVSVGRKPWAIQQILADKIACVG